MSYFIRKLSNSNRFCLICSGVWFPQPQNHMMMVCGIRFFCQIHFRPAGALSGFQQPLPEGNSASFLKNFGSISVRTINSLAHLSEMFCFRFQWTRENVGIAIDYIQKTIELFALENSKFCINIRFVSKILWNCIRASFGGLHEQKIIPQKADGWKKCVFLFKFHAVLIDQKNCSIIDIIVLIYIHIRNIAVRSTEWIIKFLWETVRKKLFEIDVKDEWIG
jgi:hypothetical protein